MRYTICEDSDSYLNPTANQSMPRIRKLFRSGFAAFRGVRGRFRVVSRGFAAVSRGFAHTAPWCLRKDSQPFRKVSQLRKRVVDW